MKRVLFAMAVLAVSTSAFAQSRIDPNGPIRQGGKCWAVSDPRGFGYFDSCASKSEAAEINKNKGVTTVEIDVAKSQIERGSGTSGDGGGGGGGGGGSGR